jgi:hypothetical protein
LSTEQRFLAKVDIAGEDDCWPWMATLINSGYGRFWYEGKTELAHRVAYVLFVGDIPTGLTIDHTCHTHECEDVICDHRRCVNPAHLEPVTQRVNLLRGNTIVADNAAKTHCLHGHRYNQANTRIINLPGGGICRQCRQCDRDRYHKETDVLQHS